MFARKLRLELAENGAVRPAPKKWLDEYFMRNFIGLSVFDEVLVTGEGEMEVGLDVDLSAVKRYFEEWLRGRKMIGPATSLEVRQKK